MAILKILQYPDLRLRTKAHEVANIKSIKIQKIIDNMMDTLSNQKDCAGLASTQLDIDNPPSITVINAPYDNQILCLVNPKILEFSGTDFEQEGCMSISPLNIHGKVKRATKIKVSALDRHSNKMLFDATDFLARCIQHECDHLQGVLFIDHLDETERKKIEKKSAETVPA